jgi:GGDEF domain-containing protein
VRPGVLDQTVYKSDVLKLGGLSLKRHSEYFTVAACQGDLDVISRLPGTVNWAKLAVHRFGSFDELFRVAQKYRLDLILFAASGKLEEEAVMIARAKDRPALATIPTVIYHPHADKSIYAEALEAGADDVLTGVWDDAVFGFKMRMFTQRSNRDLGVNPTSRLPGPVLIEREIEMRIGVGEEFAVCYLDIDNFKSYNDYYGYLYGDKVIQLTAHIVRDIVFDLVPDGFVGHVGGDDFIFIVPYEKVEIVNSNIIKAFDSIIPYKYKEIDRERGKIVARNRRGDYEVFPILTVSIAIVVNHDRMFAHVGELSHMLADLKKYTKRFAGSNYMIERRRKY